MLPLRKYRIKLPLIAKNRTAFIPFCSSKSASKVFENDRAADVNIPECPAAFYFLRISS